MAWFFPTSRITREEHDEFRRRIEQEEERQNRRLELCEMSIKEWNSLTTSVHELAVNMGNMFREQEQQGKRLEALEKKGRRKMATSNRVRYYDINRRCHWRLSKANRNVR